MKIFFLLFCFLFVHELNAQLNPKTKWGNVSQAEWNYKQVPFEKEAEAVMLYEKGTLIMNYIIAETKVYKRIKILNEAGIKYANQELIYYSDKGLESIKNIKAQTINFKDGNKSISEVDRKSFFETDLNQ